MTSQKETETLYRINRFLALTYQTSRRKAEHLVRERRVQINDEIITELSRKVSSQDKVCIDSKQVSFNQKFDYYIFNKPKGYVVSRSSQKGQKTIYSLLPSSLHHLKYAGRLDKESRGLLLLSNHGSFIQSVTHASHYILKSYRVTLNKVSKRMMNCLKQGIQDGDALLTVIHAKIISRKKSQKIVEIVLSHGYKRHIRRMFHHFDTEVLDLYRYGIGNLNLDELQLPEKKFRPFQPNQIYPGI